MSNHPTLDDSDLDRVTGGLSWDGVKDTLKSGFGLRSVYRGAVKYATAGAGGWQLANQMYGTKEHGASLSEKWRAAGAIKEFLDGSDKLPSWAPNW